MTFHNRPCAAKPFISYRAKTDYGSFIMIGATDDKDAAREAKRSTDHMVTLERWNGTQYQPVTA